MTESTFDVPLGLDERADSWRDGLSRLSDNVAEALDAVHAVGVIARQLRVLAANTSIEAAHEPGAVALNEIARRMHALSDEASHLHAALADTLTMQSHALTELRSASRHAMSEASLSSLSADLPGGFSDTVPPSRPLE